MAHQVKKLAITLPDVDSNYRFAEAIRTLRTNLIFSGSGIHNILITSASPQEGKSTISLSLAIAFAETGRKTLFVDADIRRTAFIAHYHITGPVIGLSEVLSGQAEIGEAFYGTDAVPNLEIVMAGAYAPNPTELFEDSMCGEFFDFVRQENFDVVIIDTAPVGTVIDAAILSRYADGAVILVESDVTGRRELKRVKEQLDKTGVRILGVILNKVNISKSGYYSRYYNYKKYDKYNRYNRYYEGDSDRGK
jgi:capsular exopolysaccharide synthesis family protein